MSVPLDVKEIPLFKGLPANELKLLAQFLKVRKYKKGEMVFEQSQSCENIIIVKSGRVKIFRLSSDGREQILEVLLPGDTCACNPGNLTWACSSSAQAITDSAVWTLARPHYVQMVKNNSQLMRSLTAIFAARLCRFCSLIEQVSLDSPRQRVAKFLLDMLDSEECGCHEELCVCLPFTQEEIAQRLGLARETVTRQLKNLKELKLIKMNARQIIICDRSHLEKILV